MSLISELAFRIQKRNREKRLSLFYAVIKPQKGELILDLGGGGGWYLAGEYPHKEKVIIADLSFEMSPYARDRGIQNYVVADGVALPFRSNSIDVVFCNSVIEHVREQAKMAQEIQRVCKRAYFVETPNKHFLIESHWLLPLIQYLPFRVGKAVFEKLRFVRWYPWQKFEKVYYLSPHQLRTIFPGSKVLRERFLGWTKSFIVVHTDRR